MDKFKAFINSHFEALLVVVLFLGIELIFLFAFSKTAFLDFYYLPVLLAGYFLGKKSAILTSVASVLLVAFFFIVGPFLLASESELQKIVLDVLIWAFFLLLTGLLVGNLYEQKQSKVEQLKVAYIGVLEILSKYLESHDRYTKGHSVRVADYAMETAIAMHLTRDEVENVRIAGLLHDIGKVEVSLDLLQKSAHLTKEEKQLIDKHSEKGAKLLGLVGSVLENAIPIVQAHHRYFFEEEKKKGTVPLGARIIAVADAYDAMTTDRPYQAAKPLWQALAEIEKEVGHKFDPAVVEAFKRVLLTTLEKKEVGPSVSPKI